MRISVAPHSLQRFVRFTASSVTPRSTRRIELPDAQHFAAEEHARIFREAASAHSPTASTRSAKGSGAEVTMLDCYGRELELSAEEGNEVN
jgi:hypothetical protein